MYDKWDGFDETWINSMYAIYDIYVNKEWYSYSPVPSHYSLQWKQKTSLIPGVAKSYNYEPVEMGYSFVRNGIHTVQFLLTIRYNGDKKHLSYL